MCTYQTCSKKRPHFKKLNFQIDVTQAPIDESHENTRSAIVWSTTFIKICYPHLNILILAPFSSFIAFKNYVVSTKSKSRETSGI